MERVIFACVHNAGRSQMAAAFFSTWPTRRKRPRYPPARSPATACTRKSSTAMREVGIDLGRKPTAALTDELARGASLLVTMGCGEACPYMPGLAGDDWPLANPKGRHRRGPHHSRRHSPARGGSDRIAALAVIATSSLRIRAYDVPIASFCFACSRRPSSLGARSVQCPVVMGCPSSTGPRQSSGTADLGHKDGPSTKRHGPRTDG